MAPDSVPSFDRYRTNPLFLLIGSNPLPNYVAGLLLAPEDGTLYLLHSEDTLDVAERLGRQFAKLRPTATVVLRQVDEADGDRIIAKIEEITKTFGRASRIGLNYTGGTKVMAVHAYYALRKAFPDGYFSYLDPRKLAMVIDPGNDPVQTVPVGRAVELSIQDLLRLHGYRLKSIPRRDPLQPALCRAIAEVHCSKEGMQAWRSWLNTWRAPSPSDPLPPAKLPSLAQSRELAPVIEALADLCGGEPTEEKVARALGLSELRSASKFLIGGWLEEHTLAALKTAAGAAGVHDFGTAILPEKPRITRNFDLDVVAMIGHQLFAISCRATDERDLAKEHLFEVFVHACQVGGDEARYGVVCCMNRPTSLEQELSEDWDAEGRIKVFGQDDLLALPDRLRRWFETANP